MERDRNRYKLTSSSWRRSIQWGGPPTQAALLERFPVKTLQNDHKNVIMDHATDKSDHLDINHRDDVSF